MSSTGKEGGKVAALYIRVSTLDQAREGYSLAAQQAALEAWAAQKGWSAWGSLFYWDVFASRTIRAASSGVIASDSIRFAIVSRMASHWALVIWSMSFPPALDLSVGFPPDTYSIQQTLYVVKRFVNIFLNFFRIRLTTRIGCCILTL